MDAEQQEHHVRQQGEQEEVQGGEEQELASSTRAPHIRTHRIFSQSESPLHVFLRISFSINTII